MLSSVKGVKNRRGERGDVPFRTSRFVNRNGAWYFLSREGTVEGPFDEKHQAEEAVEMYARMVAFRISDDARKVAWVARRTAALNRIKISHGTAELVPDIRAADAYAANATTPAWVWS